MTRDAVGGALPASEAHARTHTHPGPPTEPTASPAHEPRSDGLLAGEHLDLARLAVFPVRRSPNKERDKTPLVKWRDESRPRAEWDGQWPDGTNAAIDCGKSGLVVLDEDEPGAVRRWLGYEPETFTVRTGRNEGGRHLYFLAPARRSVRNSGKDSIPGLEVRGDGGYVVAPGSVHGVTGRSYEVIHDRPIAPLPSDVLDRLRSRTVGTAGPVGTLDGDVLSLDLSDFVEPFVLPEVIPDGTGRNPVVFKFACSLRARSVPDDEALPLLKDAFERCVPPLYDKDTPEAMWARVCRTYSPGVSNSGAASAHHDDGRTYVDEFWSQRPLLRAIYDFSAARMVGPWALFGAVLARAAASVPPAWVLPPTRGSIASLNVFVALCAESGGGKSAVVAASDEFLELAEPDCYLETSPGSGEGLLAAYGYMPKKDDANPDPAFRITQTSVLFAVDEVSTLAAMIERSGSTLTGFLTSAWSGSRLATQNADRTRTRNVPPHRYRLALVAGVQPLNADVILGGESTGFPQRWLWLPTYDPDTEREPGGRVGGWRWSPPDGRPEMDEHGVFVFPPEHHVTIPDEAVAAIRAAHRGENRPIGTPAPRGKLDGHAVLNRLKVAALLALLDDRAEVSADDWRLAGVVMAVSDATRAAVQRAIAADHDRADDARARRAGRSAAVARESEDETRKARAMKRVVEVLTKHGGEMAASAIMRNVGGAHAPGFKEALDRLVEAGRVVDLGERTAANGKVARYYRLA
ncbi:bifunctional DNA primase/polymerase [Isoptericola sp. NPDC056134]|uniref:bifunctional DNA primase/polymerase n=1 Tax=Isoptericola sp. NPDC056134 TaxID=3345723 RepID=UPI0035E8BF17